jgi:hypothetical protein
VRSADASLAIGHSTDDRFAMSGAGSASVAPVPPVVAFGPIQRRPATSRMIRINATMELSPDARVTVR